MTTLADKLSALGLDPARHASIQRDLADSDARALLHELLLRGFWRDVVDETVVPGPAWIEDWRRLAGSGFPMIDTAALDRLLAAGADPHDLTDVVRSMQVLTIYNIANLLDDPSEEIGVPEAPEDVDDLLELRCAGPGGRATPIHSLHSSLMERDPSGRHGGPRSLELRQLQMLDDEVRRSLAGFIRQRRFSAAAALWRRHVGGELPACLSAVQGLAGQLPKDT